ncbi:MAG: hypothetical protein JSS37_07550 [Proteobacteria bacterium]|nr:hypothetical protein [Pseudomonadota bacterium]
MRNLINLKIMLMMMALMFSINAIAATEAECKKRIITAMENAKGLGGDQADEERWGKIAANDCMKEIYSDSSLYKNSSFQSEDISVGWILFIVFFIGWLYWIWYRPDVNGWQIPFQNNELSEYDKSFLNMARKRNHANAALSCLDKEDVLKMTVQEICQNYNVEEESVREALRDRRWNTADYNAIKRNHAGAALSCLDKEDVLKMTVQEICQNYNVEEESVREALRDLGWNTADYNAVIAGALERFKNKRGRLE